MSSTTVKKNFAKSNAALLIWINKTLKLKMSSEQHFMEKGGKSYRATEIQIQCFIANGDSKVKLWR